MAPAAPRFAELLAARLRHGLLRSPEQPDLAGGALGGLCALLSLVESDEAYIVECVPESLFSEWCDYGVEIAEAFIDTPAQDGIYLGLLHGLAGAVAVIERLHRHRPIECIAQFRQYAIAVFTDHVQTLPHGGQAWPITTVEDELTFFATCAGAPGITVGLTAAHLWSDFHGYLPLVRAGLTILSDDLTRSAHVPAYSLCCGQLGNIHALAWLGHHLEQPALLERARAAYADLALADVRAEAITRRLERSLLADELGWLYTGLHLYHPDRLSHIALF
jgi:lantibiotic modifying enzyme